MCIKTSYDYIYSYHDFFRIVEEDEPMHDDFHKPQAFFDQVHDGIVLPLEICDHLLQTMVAEGLDIDDRVAKAFR